MKKRTPLARIETASFFGGRRNEMETATKKDTVDSRIKLLKNKRDARREVRDSKFKIQNLIFKVWDSPHYSLPITYYS